MKELVNKYVELEQKMAEEKGPFTLFALFLRAEAVNVWDLLVAAPWIESDWEGSMPYITRHIQAKLTTDELLRLSRVVFIDQNNPVLEDIPPARSGESGVVELRDSDLFGMEIKRAYIITSQTPSQPSHKIAQVAAA